MLDILSVAIIGNLNKLQFTFYFKNSGIGSNTCVRTMWNQPFCYMPGGEILSWFSSTIKMGQLVSFSFLDYLQR